MDGYLKRHLSNPVYGGTAPNRRTESAWYASCDRLQTVRHNAAKCWEGYERVPGTKEYAEGSCRKKGSGGKKKKKSKDKAAKKGDGGGSSSSSSSDDEDGKPKAKKAKKD